LRKFLKYSGIASVWTFIVGLLSGFQSQEGGLAAFFLILVAFLQGCGFSLEIQGTGSGHVTDANNVSSINCVITTGLASAGCIDSSVNLGRDANGELRKVILVATPVLGFAFDSWENCPKPVLSTCTIDSPDDDLIITVNFSVLTASNQLNVALAQACLGRVCQPSSARKNWY